MATKKDDIAHLSKVDIIKIIKACSENKVESLKIDGLEISFKPGVSDQTPNWPEITKSKIKEDLSTEVPDPRLDQALSDLMVTDPEAYEQAIQDGVMDGRAEEDFRSQ